MAERLGDAPIEPHLHEMMNALGRAIDVSLNAKNAMGGGPKVGFVLLAFPFDGHEGRCNYISNAKREDVVVLLKEQLARFEGQPETSGHA